MIRALIAPVALIASVAAAQGVAVLPGGTRVTESKLGAGTLAEPGRTVAVHYTGWTWVDGMKGRKFDSSRGSQPFVFQIGAGEVILGWDEGISGMKVGGTRTLIVPPSAGYGDNGAGDLIPPGATLYFEVELVAVAQ